MLPLFIDISLIQYLIKFYPYKGDQGNYTIKILC